MLSTTEYEHERSHPAIEINGQQLATPRLALYTKTGCIPYINFNFVRNTDGIFYRDKSANGETQETIQNELLIINVADLLDLYSSNVLEHFAQQTYFKNYGFMITMFNPLSSSYFDLKSTPDSIPVMTVQGKKMVTVKDMDKIVKQINSEHFQSLADINTPPIAKKKWTAKAVNRSSQFLEQTINLLADCETVKSDDSCNKRIKLNGSSAPLKMGRVWATITGGYSIKDRVDSCRNVSQHDDKLFGFVIDSFYGYHSNRDEASYFDSFHDCAQLLREHILPNLPSVKPRALWGAFLPDDMIRAISYGIDVLDSSICTTLTQRSLALPSPLIDMDHVRLRFIRIGNCGDDDQNNPSPTTLLDLGSSIHQRSNIPMSSSCQCYTCCRSYSRAYINHLLKRNELNGSMLLQIHNHYTLTQFMGHLRQLIRMGQFHRLLLSDDYTDQEASNGFE